MVVMGGMVLVRPPAVINFYFVPQRHWKLFTGNSLLKILKDKILLVILVLGLCVPLIERAAEVSHLRKNKNSRLEP